MLKIGITGGIGSGKTVVSKIFESLGAPVYDADSRAKNLMVSNPELVKSIKSNFGDQSYGVNGELNRAYLASVVFSDKEKTKLINSLVHPWVGADFQDWMDKQKNPYIIKEAALLIESGSYKQLDKLILVSAPEEIRMDRVLKRDPQRSKESVRAIMDKQMSEEEMKSYADFIIDNSGKKPILKDILELHRVFLKGN